MHGIPHVRRLEAICGTMRIGRSRSSEARGGIPEMRMWNVECGMWDVGCGMWDVGCGMC